MIIPKMKNVFVQGTFMVYKDIRVNTEVIM
jgi:hypothetical protein